jgi:pimeloyl-ACP methyl ester carboxylesterase
MVFFGGFRSDMTGSKARALEDLSRRLGTAFVRFDYFGHGVSSGRFEQGTIGRWRDDGLAVVDELTEGPLLLVGSSMGAWIALLVALARPARVGALVGIASAPDFTEELIWQRCTPEERSTLEREGLLWRHSPGEEQPWALTHRLIEEARLHCVLAGPVPLRCPVRLVHGLSDAEVPWDLSRRLVENLESDDVELILVKRGDHRLSSTPDLKRLETLVTPLLR